MNGKNNNFIVQCPIAKAWSSYNEEIGESIGQIKEIHSFINEVSPHLQCLSALPTIAATIVDMKDKLLASAISKDHIDTKVADGIFSRQEKVFKAIYWILGIVILVLLFVIGFLLTGERLGIINGLHR